LLEGYCTDSGYLIKSWGSELEKFDNGNKLSDGCSKCSELDFSEVSFFKENVSESHDVVDSAEGGNLD